MSPDQTHGRSEIPSTDTLGREPIVAGALAEPQFADQLAALPPGTSSSAEPPLADSVADQSAVLPTDQVAALPDTTSFTPAPDLAPAMGALPPAITDVGIGLIKVTMLSPDLGGLGFSSGVPPIASPLSDPGLSYGYGGGSASPLATPRAIPQDHNVMRSVETHDTHTAPPPSEVHAAAPAAPPAQAGPTGKPTSLVTPHPVFPIEAGGSAAFPWGGRDDDSFVKMLGTGFKPPSPPPAHSLSVESAPNGGYTFFQDDQSITIAPGGHGTIGSGSFAYAIDVGAGGSVSIAALNGGITLAGASTVGGYLTLTTTGAGSISLVNPSNASGGENVSLTVSSAGNITQSGVFGLSNAHATILSAGYSATEHIALVAGQPDPHTHS